MSNYNDKGLTMDNWHKCPNAIVDRLMGVVLTPSAVCVVLTIWRLTEGVRERHQAAIPTETFMRVTGTKRKNTAYQYVNEAVESGLISVQKNRGKVSIYSINKKCPLWYNVEVVAEIVPTLEEKEVVAESDSSSDKCNIVVAESAIGLDESSGGKRHTYKDIKIKDNIKDKKKESDEQTASNDKPKPPIKKPKTLNIPFDDFWNGYDKKKDTAKCEKKWSSLTDNERELIMAHIPAYVKSTPDKKYRKNPMTYFNGKCWLDEIDQPTATKIDRTTDKLAVNQNWAGANKSNIVESNITLEEMMGSW